MSDTAGLQAVGTESVKARNVAANNNVTMHWQGAENGDGDESWGTVERLLKDLAIAVWR